MTATPLPELQPDHVHIVVEQQFPRMPPPGVYQWPIGAAHEAIRNGRAKIDSRSAKEFDAFQKSTIAAQKKFADERGKDVRDAELAARERQKAEGIKRSPDGGLISPSEERKNLGSA